MPSDLTFAFAASVRDWPHQWARHIADHGPGRLVDRVAERKSVFDRRYRVFVADADSGLLDHKLVEDLHHRGIALVAVWDPTDARTKERALDLGADTLVEADARPEEFLRLAQGVIYANALEADYDPPDPEVDTIAEAPSITRTTPRPANQKRRGGRRIVVGGPVGDDADDLTVELARAIARRGDRTVVVDANDVAPGVAQRLALPVLPNLRIAVDSLHERDLRLSDALLAVPAGGFWALVGLADPGQWAEVAPSDVVEVIDELAVQTDAVVVRAGPHAEDLADLGGPDRFGITRAVLADADVIVGVSTATPTGLARLVGWVADVRLIAPTTRIDLVFTRSPQARFTRNELGGLMRAATGVTAIHLLPPDPGLELASWNGTFVKKGPFRTAATALAASVAPPATKRRNRGRQPAGVPVHA